MTGATVLAADVVVGPTDDAAPEDRAVPDTVGETALVGGAAGLAAVGLGGAAVTVGDT
jgi:hypothetical protein